jgi:hypothetical protein
MPKIEDMAVDTAEGLRCQERARRAANGPTRMVQRSRYRKGFLIFPAAWNEALSTLPPIAHAAAYSLLRRRWSRGETTIAVGNVAFGNVGITRYTKMAALKLLEGAELITIEFRGRRKSPVVTLRKLE